ncbi:cytochrome ubiquinol oxidase subunit I, partial [Bacillus pumilus]|uniref:cytochrome ubiquinol oxidase subunit I n=1 Tax=Bacillus pumilus TaxID=1408 RepID=UPI001642AF1B
FLESTFIRLSIFPCHPFPNNIHLFSISLLSLPTIFSPFSILLPNSFIQQPLPFLIKNPPPQINHFPPLLTNPHLSLQFPHLLFPPLPTGPFFIPP